MVKNPPYVDESRRYDRSVPSKHVPLEESDVPPWQNTPLMWRLAVTAVDGYRAQGGGRCCCCCCFMLPWFVIITIYTKDGLLVVDVVVVFVIAIVINTTVSWGVVGAISTLFLIGLLQGWRGAGCARASTHG